MHFLLAKYCFIFCLLVKPFVQMQHSNVLDLDDILSSNYMPGTLLLLDKSIENDIVNITSQNHRNIFDGSYNKALDTMDFHRSMMNQYLCRTYVADQILSDFNQNKFEKRMGHASPAMLDNQMNTSKHIHSKNNLLMDEGSSSYQNWLSKSTTLEDIYRNHNDLENRIDVNEMTDESDEKSGANREQFPVNMGDYSSKASQGKPNKIGNRGLYYPGGGYYFPGHQGYLQEYGGLGSMNYQDEHSVEHEPVVYHYTPKYQVHHSSGYNKYDKAEELADLFEIALTALAYLSFGMFIAHLIMSISTIKNNATSTAASMMMPMSMSPTATAAGTGSADTGGGDTGNTGAGNGNPTGGGSTNPGGGMAATGTAGGDTSDGGGDMTSNGGGMTNPGTSTGGDMVNTSDGSTGSTSPSTGNGGGTGTGNGDTMDSEMDGTATGSDTGAGTDTFKFRLKRDIPKITNPDNSALNELAKRVLSSIDAAMIVHNDGGECLKKSLCINNQYSRGLKGLNKILIPVWSIGMSWLLGRLNNKKNATSGTMIDGLKATILGLGMANCEIAFQECDIRKNNFKSKIKKRK